MTCEQCHRREAIDGHLLCMVCAAGELDDIDGEYGDSWDDEA